MRDVILNMFRVENEASQSKVIPPDHKESNDDVADADIEEINPISKEKTRYCSSCGSKLEEKVIFCSNCGHKI